MYIMHHGLARTIQELLSPQIAPKYVARVETYTVEDVAPSTEAGISYPDIAILKPERLEEPATVTYGNRKVVVTEPDVLISTSITVKIPVVKIKDLQSNQLITCIEILSPVNKNSAGWQSYHEKREDLHTAGVHLLEIDLLCRGKRHIWNVGKPDPHYVFSLWRAGTGKIAVWRNFVQEQLPILPVPLKGPDPDVLLELKKALDLIYERSMYYLAIDYNKKPPPPDFSEEATKWIRENVKA